MHFYILVQ